MCLGSFLIFKVTVIGTYYLYTIFLCKLYEYFVGFLLQRISLTVCHQTWVFYFMALQLKVEIISKDTMIPFASFSCTLDIIMDNLVRDFTCNTSRTHNQAFMILLKLLTVCTGTIVITIYPRIRYKFNKILVSCIVLCQYDKVVA